MKRLLPILGLIAALSSCAKQRTVTQFSTEGMEPEGSDISILTNSDYEKQEDEKKKQKLNRKKDRLVKPVPNPENIIKMDMDFEQADLAKLYEALDVEAISVGPPAGVYEYIGQERLEKSIGRLTCTKQRPLPEEIRSITEPRFYCLMDTTQNKIFTRQDKLLYEYLNLTEALDANSSIDDVKVFEKAVGRFHCEKSINITTGNVSYTCSIYQIYSATTSN